MLSPETNLLYTTLTRSQKLISRRKHHQFDLIHAATHIFSSFLTSHSLIASSRVPNFSASYQNPKLDRVLSCLSSNRSQKSPLGDNATNMISFVCPLNCYTSLASISSKSTLFKFDSVKSADVIFTPLIRELSMSARISSLQKDQRLLT